MSIIRAPRPETKFYILDKSISEDKRLGWAARGFLIYLLGKPDHWKVSIQALINETGEASEKSSRDRAYSIIKQLIDAGYITRTQGKGDGGKFAAYDYVVSETPVTPSPRPGCPDTGEPRPAKPTQASNEYKQGLKKGSNAPADAGSPPNVQFDGTDFVVTEALLTKWAKAFPGVNIDLEVERASVWAASNPPKKDWQRFLSNWLSKKSGTVVDETNVPVDQIIDLYKQVCPNLPAVTVAGDKILRSMIVERWNESPTHQSGKDFWLPFFQKANNRNQVFFRGANVVPRLEALVSRSVFREISEAAQ